LDFVLEDDRAPLLSFLAASEGNGEGTESNDETTPTHMRVCLRDATCTRVKVDITAISFQDIEGHTGHMIGISEAGNGLQSASSYPSRSSHVEQAGAQAVRSDELESSTTGRSHPSSDDSTTPADVLGAMPNLDISMVVNGDLEIQSLSSSLAILYAGLLHKQDVSVILDTPLRCSLQEWANQTSYNGSTTLPRQRSVLSGPGRGPGLSCMCTISQSPSLGVSRADFSSMQIRIAMTDFKKHKRMSTRRQGRESDTTGRSRSPDPQVIGSQSSASLSVPIAL